MNYEIEGNLKEIMDTQTFDSGFQKREFVVTTEEKYPQDIKLEFVKEKCADLDGFAKGQRVKAAFNLRGNEYKGRYYVNLNAWKLEALAGEASSPAAVASSDIDEEDAPF